MKWERLFLLLSLVLLLIQISPPSGLTVRLDEGVHEMQLTAYNYIPFGPSHITQWGAATSWSDFTGMVLDGDTEKLAVKHMPSVTAGIASVDIRLNIVGAPGNFRIGVFAHDVANNAPDDATQLGSYTAAFAAPAADGWTGSKSLAAATGNLTVNTPVWVVIEYVSGTIDSSNYIQLQRQSNAGVINALCRHHNGTNWTTTTSVAQHASIIIGHTGGSYSGHGFTAVLARSSKADIYVNGEDNQVQGLRLKAGAQMKIGGIIIQITKTGTPNDLVITIYEGDTLKQSATIDDALVVSGSQQAWFFTSPILLSADTYIYIICSQTGTSDSHDYDLQTYTIDPTYITASAPDDWRFVSGALSTGPQTDLTVDTTGIEIPFIYPLIVDPAADLDQAASGGVRDMASGMMRGMAGMLK